MSNQTVRVWDPVIRMFHWGLVAAMAVAWLSAEGWDDLHAIAGYVVAGLLAVRLIWGLVGSRYARFTQFLCRPSMVIAYIRDMTSGRERRYLGHNPAGAAMIVALLLVLAGTAWTGWLLENGAKGLIKDLHEVLANGGLFLIAAHVGGVIVASIRHRENLARAMVTGDKRAAGGSDVA